MSVFDDRRGLSREQSQLAGAAAAGGGLAGFTTTLIDAVTRLIGYVNEVSSLIAAAASAANCLRVCYLSALTHVPRETCRLFCC